MRFWLEWTPGADASNPALTHVLVTASFRFRKESSYIELRYLSRPRPTTSRGRSFCCPVQELPGWLIWRIKGRHVDVG